MIEPPPVGPIEPGNEVGDFAIEAMAGRGGMGVVYRARQKKPARIVALKVIAPDLAHDPAFRARFGGRLSNGGKTANKSSTNAR
jgi:serine/threonine protein kinase